jgi:hypothetical protein
VSKDFTITDIDISLVTLIVVVAVGMMVLLALFRRPKVDDSGHRSEIQSLTSKVELKDKDLREASSKVDRSEALAGERKAELERLNSDLSK